MLTKEEIKNRIGFDGGEFIDSYNGFDMTGEGDNSELLKLFEDGFDSNIVGDCLSFHKGSGKLELETLKKDFSGWNTYEIIYWLIQNREEIETKWFSILNRNIIREYNSEREDNSVSRVIPKESRYIVLKRQSWKCNQCGETLKYSSNSNWKGEIAHIDHVFPYSKREHYARGQTMINELSNLQALCPKCNLSKKDKVVH